MFQPLDFSDISKNTEGAFHNIKSEINLETEPIKCNPECSTGLLMV